MPQSQSYLKWGCLLLLGGALLAACGQPSTLEEVPTETTSIETTSTAPVERLSREEILDDFADSMRRAEATQGAGAPALWQVRDADTVIHMFGTVHMLRPELQWRTPEMNAAFEASDTIVFEVDMKSPEAQRAIMTDFLSRGMFEDGRTLSGVLDAEVEEAIAEAFLSLGVPLSAMETFEPWMASINLSVMQLTADGYDAESGVESVLEAEASAAGKDFAYLESIREQADAFDLLPEQDQIDMLYASALTLDKSADMLDLLVGEWADGDAEGLTALVASSDGAGFTDATYEAVLVTRNRNWVPRIEAMLETPGTVFIAAGAAHFVGPDSVVAMLREKGYEVTGP